MFWWEKASHISLFSAPSNKFHVVFEGGSVQCTNYFDSQFFLTGHAAAVCLFICSVDKIMPQPFCNFTSYTNILEALKFMHPNYFVCFSVFQNGCTCSMIIRTTEVHVKSLVCYTAGLSNLWLLGVPQANLWAASPWKRYMICGPHGCPTGRFPPCN